MKSQGIDSVDKMLLSGTFNDGGYVLNSLGPVPTDSKPEHEGKWIDITEAAIKFAVETCR